MKAMRCLRSTMVLHRKQVPRSESCHIYLFHLTHTLEANMELACAIGHLAFVRQVLLTCSGVEGTRCAACGIVSSRQANPIEVNSSSFLSSILHTHLEPRASMFD